MGAIARQSRARKEARVGLRQDVTKQGRKALSGRGPSFSRSLLTVLYTGRGMSKLIANIVIVLGLVGCSTNYKLNDIGDPVLADKSSAIECSGESNAINEKMPDLCESIGFRRGFGNSCGVNDQSCVRIHVKEEFHFFDVSPGMLLFLGLIPSTQYYTYEVAITRLDPDGVEQTDIEEFEIVQSWSTINSFKRFLGGISDLKTEQNKIGKYIRDKYGLRI